MYVLFDVGGTKTRIAVSKNGEGFGEPKIFSTPQSFDEGISLIIGAGKELLNGERATVVAGGIAGPLNLKKTKLVNSPNLPGWIQKPLHKELFKAFGAPVFLENDTALVGLGETHYGKGQGHKIVVYMTFSTGVGGARYVNGKIDANTFGFEPGHQYIEGTKKDLDALVSGKGIESIYGVTPENITDARIWEEITEKMAIGVHNTLVMWSPEIIILGGGLIQHAVKIESIKAGLDKILKIFPNSPKLEGCVLGSTGGLFGALVFAKQNL
ncbi:MAG: ROK family protein [Patescibacteria group bacterium]